MFIIIVNNSSILYEGDTLVKDLVYAYESTSSTLHTRQLINTCRRG